MSLHVADIVAKVFLGSERAILIQDQASKRNIDSQIYVHRFECCARTTPRRLLQQYRHKAAQSQYLGMSAAAES